MALLTGQLSEVTENGMRGGMTCYEGPQFSEFIHKIILTREAACFMYCDNNIFID